MSKTTSQSPIKEKPLRRPGTALQKKIIDSYIAPVYYAGMVPVLMLGALVGGYFPQRGWSPIVINVAAIAIYEGILYAVFLRKAWRNIAKLKLGYEGEVYVGQQLDEMRANGWLILHDFQTGKGNIDHIIIAPQGVFTLETKTVSIHEDEENCIWYDCQKVWTNKRNIDSPLSQAKGEAKFLGNYINQKLTMNVFVQPIVTYPGWDYKYCGSQTLAECEVWICLTRGLASVINSRGRILRQDEMRRIYNFLASENRI